MGTSECLRQLFPEEVSPTGVTQQESIRHDWTTWTNVDRWFEKNKATLLESGLAKDEPLVLPDGTECEITIGPQELARIGNFDETDHSFSTLPDKGGSRSLRWGDPSLPKGTERGTRGSRHTTGIYGTAANGEVYPPVYCYDSSAANAENFQVRTSWAVGLPKVSGFYGCRT